MVEDVFKVRRGFAAGDGRESVFATLGVYTLDNGLIDVALLLGIGMLGLVMRMLDVPVAPCVVALILGPMAERHMRRALAISQGDPLVFVSSPLAAGMLALAFAFLIVPMMMKLRRRPVAVT